ncbi:MAG: DnaJ domain-containing protein [Myxococcota bacterium]|nr:DnaJ domain-containing protein [Myxococcota bacterium]
MTPWELSYLKLGADVLVELASERRTGSLFWDIDNDTLTIVFVSGRPQVLVDTRGVKHSSRESVAKGIRLLSQGARGVCRFQPGELSDFAHLETLRVDTLKEVLIHLATRLPMPILRGCAVIRKNWILEAGPNFDRIAELLFKLSESRFEKPNGRISFINALGDSEEQARLCLALLTLKGLVVVEDKTPLSKLQDDFTGRESIVLEFGDNDGSVAESSASNESCRENESVVRLREDYSAFKNADHYTLLGLQSSSSEDSLEKAFIERAKQWHGDRYRALDDQEIEEMAHQLFIRTEEAYQTLKDPARRSEYDFILSQKKKGLPTDPREILDMEVSYQKAVRMLQHGKAAAALSLLKGVVKSNPSEPEYLACYSYACYRCADDDEQRDAAWKKLLENEEGWREKEIIHEFIGRVAQERDELETARYHLQMTLQINPQNIDAVRALRLLNLRKANSDKTGGTILKKIKGFLGGS